MKYGDSFFRGNVESIKKVFREGFYSTLLKTPYVVLCIVVGIPFSVLIDFFIALGEDK